MLSVTAHRIGLMFKLPGEQTQLNSFVPFKHGVYAKRVFAPLGSKFFPLKYIPFQKGVGVQESKLVATKVVSLVNKDEKTSSL